MMTITGNTFISLSDSSIFTVDSSFLISNVTGAFSLIASGNDENIKFDFISGKIIDSDGNFVYGYKPDTRIRLTIESLNTGYSYSINGSIISNGIPKNDFEVTGIYLQPDNCSVIFEELNVKSIKPEASLSVSGNFNQSGILSGKLNNLTPDIAFRILSGEISVGSEYFEFSGLSNDVIESSYDFNLKNIDYNLSEYDLSLKFYTNFGTISQSFTVTGIPINDVTEVIDFTIEKTFESSTEKLFEINGTFDKISGKLKESVSKSLDFEFGLWSGETGEPFSGFWQIKTGLDQIFNEIDSGSYLSTGYYTTINLLSDDRSFYISLDNNAYSGSAERVFYYTLSTEQNIFSGLITGINGG
jgi:hypothetical protein